MMVSATSTLSREDVEQIRALVEEHWVQAGLARAWDKTLALCAPDIVYMPPDQAALHGHHELREWLERFPPIIEFAQPLESIEGHGNTASVRTAFSATVDAGGSQLRNTGKGLSCLQKDSLGRWLVKTVCFNWDRPMGVA